MDEESTRLRLVPFSITTRSPIQSLRQTQLVQHWRFTPLAGRSATAQYMNLVGQPNRWSHGLQLSTIVQKLYLDKPD